MQACSELIHWIDVTDLDHLNHGQAMAMVKSTIEALEALDEEPSEDLERAFEALLGIHDDFVEGGLPVSALRAFRETYRDVFTTGQLDGTSSLEDELRDLADDLEEEEWCTGAYLKFEAGIDAYMDGEVQLLEQAISDLERVIEQAWEGYVDLPLAETEITAESVAGHGLLLEGVQEWFTALETAREAAENKADWEDALEIAQNANRLLVAVQRFSARIQNTV